MRHAHTEAGFIGTMALRLFLLFLVVSQVTFLGTRYRLRWDLTGDKLYTLTGSTRKVLGKLGDHLLIEAYFSPDSKLPPTYRPLRAAMRHVLDEYVKLGNGRVIVRFFDPTSDTRLREKALRLGIQPQRMADTSGGSAASQAVAIREVWQGLRLRYGDKKQEILPLMPFEANTFEYEAKLTPRIRQLTVADKPKIGFLAYPLIPGTPYIGERPGKRRRYDRLLRYFGNLYDFRPLALKQGQLIPQDLEAVILIRPKWLTDREKFAIDQYLVGGGKLVIFADNAEVEVRDDIQNQVRIEPVAYDDKRSRLKFLDQLAHYGAKVENRIVSDGVKEAWQFYAILYQDPRTMQQGLLPLEYPYLLEALDVDWRQHADKFAPRNQTGQVDEAQAQRLKESLKPGVARDHDLMAQVLRVGIPGFFWPCPVNLTAELPADVQGQVLLRTSPLAWDETPPEEIDPFNRYRDERGREAKYREWMRQQQATRQMTPPKQIGLMVHLKGRFSSFFAGRKVPPRPDDPNKKEADPLEWDEGKDKKDKDKDKEKTDLVGPLPGKQKPATEDPDKDPPMITKGTKEGSLLVIGDADFVRDDYLAPAYSRPAPKSVPPVVVGPMPKDWQRPERAARFFLNVLSWLAEEKDLLDLMNKTPTNRTLVFATHDAAHGENVKEFQERVETITSWIRWTNTLLPCLVLVVVGLIVVVRRRAQKVAFLASLGA